MWEGTFFCHVLLPLTLFTSVMWKLMCCGELCPGRSTVVRRSFLKQVLSLSGGRMILEGRTNKGKCVRAGKKKKKR